MKSTIYRSKPCVVFGLILYAFADSSTSVAGQQDIFDSRDSRVFKTTACTKDHQPVEALYYIIASRADLDAGKPSPSSSFIKEAVDRNWSQVAVRLKREEITDEQFTDTYHSTLSEMIPALEQTVETQSGVSISVSEVNARPMDTTKDSDIPNCE